MKRLIILIFSIILLSGCNESLTNLKQTHDIADTPNESAAKAESSVIAVDNTVEVEFTETEISDAKAVIEKYFKAKKEKDAKKIVECYHPSRLTIENVESGKTILFEHEEINLLTIYEYDYDFQKCFDSNAILKFSESNLIVLKVDYEVSFPNGDSENSCYNEGIYSDWAMILVRDDANSPWLIFDQGY